MSEQSFAAPPQQGEPSMIELVVQELQNRIGQITTEYETKVAVLKAQATNELRSKDERINELIKALAEAKSGKS